MVLTNDGTTASASLIAFILGAFEAVEANAVGLAIVKPNPFNSCSLPDIYHSNACFLNASALLVQSFMPVGSLPLSM